MEIKKGAIDDRNLFLTNAELKNQFELFLESKNFPSSLKIDETAIFNKFQNLKLSSDSTNEQKIEEFMDVEKGSGIPKIRKRSNSEPELAILDLVAANKDPVIVENMKKECNMLQMIT